MFFLLPLSMYNAQLNHTQTVRLYYISVNIVVLYYVMIVNKLNSRGPEVFVSAAVMPGRVFKSSFNSKP